MGGVVVGYGATGGDAAFTGHAAEHEVEGVAADVVEVDLDKTVGGLFEVVFEGGGFVIKANVGAEALDPSAFD